MGLECRQFRGGVQLWRGGGGADTAFSLPPSLLLSFPPSTPHLLSVFLSLASLIFLSVGLCIFLHFPRFRSFLKWIPLPCLLLLPLFFPSDLSPPMPTSVSHLHLILSRVSPQSRILAKSLDF